MQYELQYSIKRYLETAIGVPVVWIYDGVTLPTIKPFITVEQMQSNNEIKSKMRESIETIFRFQVGLYMASSTAKSRMQTQVTDAINFEQITLYQTSTSPITAVGFFDAFVTNAVPIPWAAPDEESKKHLVFLDVEITQIYGRK